MVDEKEISRVEDVILGMSEELSALSAYVPKLMGEIDSTLDKRDAAALAITQRAVVDQCTSIRLELAAELEKQLPAVLATRKKPLSLDELTHTLSAIAAKVFQAKQIEAEAAAKTETLEIVKRELAAVQPTDATPIERNLADVFRGNWNTELSLKRGDVFGYRGGSYLCLIDSIGVPPTRESQTGPNPRYGLLSAPGAPGLSAPPLPNFVSTDVQNQSSVTGLASAGANAVKLAGLTTGGGAMPVGAVVMLNFSVTINDGAGTHSGILTMFFQLLSSTHASSAPLWLRPWDYGASNQVVWRLLSAFLDTLPASYNADTGFFHYMGCAGAANAVFGYFDQTGTAAPA